MFLYKKNMMYFSRILIFIFVSSFVSLVSQEKRTFPNYKNQLLESFNGPESGKIDLSLGDDSPAIVWKTFGSLFSEEGYPKETYVPNTWPIDALGVSPPEPDKLQVLGLKAKFKRFGYNVVEVVPGYEDDDQKWQAGIALNGIPVSLSIWVWGAMFNYTVEAHIQDSEGIVHAIKFLRGKNSDESLTDRMDSLRFKGWRNMVATIPPRIGTPSLNRSIDGKKIKLTKIVFRSSPYEQVETAFYVYLDRLELLSNNYVNFFDGDKLADPVKIKEIWGDNSGDKEEKKSEETQ